MVVYYLAIFISVNWSLQITKVG